MLPVTLFPNIELGNENGNGTLRGARNPLAGYCLERPA